MSRNREREVLSYGEDYAYRRDEITEERKMYKWCFRRMPWNCEFWEGFPALGKWIVMNWLPWEWKYGAGYVRLFAWDPRSFILDSARWDVFRGKTTEVVENFRSGVLWGIWSAVFIKLFAVVLLPVYVAARFVLTPVIALMDSFLVKIILILLIAFAGSVIIALIANEFFY